jgi:hypothetical protein
MQQWEYMTVASDLAGGDRPLVRWINGAEVENWKQGPQLHERLNQFGADGWELVTVDLFGTRLPRMVFIRPRA